MQCRTSTPRLLHSLPFSAKVGPSNPQPELGCSRDESNWQEWCATHPSCLRVALIAVAACMQATVCKCTGRGWRMNSTSTILDTTSAKVDLSVGGCRTSNLSLTGGRALINFKEPLRKFSPQPAAAPAADGTKTFGTLIRDSIAKAVPVHEVISTTTLPRLTPLCSQIMGLLEQEFPDVFYMSGQKLKESIESRVGRHAPVAHPLSSFVPPWDQPFEFTIDGSGAPSLWPRSIVLTGPAACGKTSLAKAQGDRPLVVHNGCLEALRYKAPCKLVANDSLITLGTSCLTARTKPLT